MSLGQAIVIANKMTQSAADGYTLGVVAETLAIQQHLIKDLPYDGLNAFSPVAMLVFSSLLLVPNPAFAPGTLRDLIAHAKTNSGKVSHVSSGHGAQNHIGAGLLACRANVELLHVPYRGAVAMLQAVVAGDMSFTFATPAAALPLTRSGKLRLLAVASKSRWAHQREVPTVAEAFPGFDLLAWFGVAGPARPPSSIVVRLNRKIVRALAQTEVTEKLGGLALEPGSMSPEEFDYHFSRWSAEMSEASRGGRSASAKAAIRVPSAAQWPAPCPE